MPEQLDKAFSYSRQERWDQNFSDANLFHEAFIRTIEDDQQLIRHDTQLSLLAKSLPEQRAAIIDRVLIEEPKLPGLSRESLEEMMKNTILSVAMDDLVIGILRGRPVEPEQFERIVASLTTDNNRIRSIVDRYRRVLMRVERDRENLERYQAESLSQTLERYRANDEQGYDPLITSSIVAIQTIDQGLREGTVELYRGGTSIRDEVNHLALPLADAIYFKSQGDRYVFEYKASEPLPKDIPLLPPRGPDDSSKTFIHIPLQDNNQQ